MLNDHPNQIDRMVNWHNSNRKLILSVSFDFYCVCVYNLLLHSKKRSITGKCEQFFWPIFSKHTIHDICTACMKYLCALLVFDCSSIEAMLVSSKLNDNHYESASDIISVLSLIYVFGWHTFTPTIDSTQFPS